MACIHGHGMGDVQVVSSCMAAVWVWGWKVMAAGRHGIAPSELLRAEYAWSGC